MHAFVDRILMRTGKGCKYQLAAVRMAGMNVHLCAPLVNLADLLDILNRKLRIDPLRKHIIGDIQNVHISGPLSVAKQRPFHTVCSCQ